MEIAVSTLFNLPRPFEESIKVIPGLGTKCLELVDAGPHALNHIRVQELLKLKEDHGLSYSVHAPFTDVNISAYDDGVREAILKRLKASIKWTSELGGEILVFHPGNSTVLERAIPDEAWQINLESVRDLVAYADKMRVRALIENVPDPYPYVLKSVRDFERFYEEIGVEVGVVLDIAHANLRGEALDFIERFGDLIAHVHVSDNQGDSDTHLRVGGGSIDWPRIMAALKDSPFEGWITIESYNGVMESLELLKAIM
ncbi:MAG: sugar phosphate isomerase/epimerase family protein [Candidatus Bathyarchaeota archaeon]|jgi:sugar phosphate isomerase/epimerase